MQSFGPPGIEFQTNARKQCSIDCVRLHRICKAIKQKQQHLYSLVESIQKQILVVSIQILSKWFLARRSCNMNQIYCHLLSGNVRLHNASQSDLS